MLELTVNGLEEVQAKLGRLSDLDSMADDFAAAMLRASDNTFDRQGTVERRWVPLSPNTRGPRKGILEVTGRLRESLLVQLSSDGEVIEVGSPWVYGRFQLLGTRTTPARGFLSAPEEEDVARVWSSHVERSLA